VAEYGGDPSRIAYAGESAGANLATALAIAGCWRRDERFARAVWDLGLAPAAVLPACGILEVTNSERYLTRDDLPIWVRDRIARVCRCYLPEAGPDPDAVALASPLTFLERASLPDRPLPPFFAPCGAADWIADDSRRLDRALDRLGIIHESPFYEGGIHAFHALMWTDLSRRLWDDQDAFLSRHVGPARGRPNGPG
jgi:acetyl esterase